ncbi:hypothetical protein, partial [Vibrio aestuarianus]
FEGNNAHLPTAQNEWPEKSQKIEPLILSELHNAALRCERRLAILERSENAKRCESLLNALLGIF